MLGAFLMKAMMGASAGALVLSALALAGCGSEQDRPIGPGPDPGGGTGVALVFADSALQSAVEEAAAAAGTCRRWRGSGVCATSIWGATGWRR